MDQTRTLLIVDDEPRVLEVLVRTFENQYRVVACGNGTEALEALRTSDANVIITDERMPRMTGMSFLKEARRINPRTVNIILTAYSDITVAIEAINSGIVYRYLVKPWDTEELMIIIRQAFERYLLIENNRALTEELVRKNESLEDKIRELETAREKLLRSEKLGLIGQLTASIGHELKNPLSRIKAAAGILRSEKETTTTEERAELLRIIDNEVMIATKIINDLLDFSRDRKAVLKPENLNRIVADTVGRLKIPPHIALDQQLEFSLPEIPLDEGQVQQILINLLMNAIQALDNGGKIYLKTERAAGRVVVSIKDTGCGMSREQVAKIFEPLYTTKPKGIGLGMSIVKMLVEKHGGRIHVESRENIGTTVTIDFPANGQRSEE